MNNQEKKHLLLRYLAIKAQIYDLEAESSAWREFGESITQKLSDMPHGSGVGDKVGSAAAWIKHIDKQISEKFRELTEERIKIESYIEAVEDDTLRRILRLRYISGRTWEQISAAIGYSYVHTVRLHGEALAAVKIEEAG